MNTRIFDRMLPTLDTELAAEVADTATVVKG